MTRTIVTINDNRHTTRDAGWDETKHPRANNGQFGAGEGKSHAEHRAHHEAKAEEHRKLGIAAGESGQPSKTGPHLHASLLHAGAANQHAWASNEKLSKYAHGASAVANEASKASQTKSGAHTEQANQHRQQAQGHAREVAYSGSTEHEHANAAHTRAAIAHEKAAKDPSHKEAAAAASKEAHEASEKTKSGGKRTIEQAVEQELVNAMVKKTGVDAMRAKKEIETAKKTAKSLGLPLTDTLRHLGFL